ncbi:MAG: hypothetical protein HC836_25770 [Richelia sp. RM2_1_2]|nr:hypothetical protein [Richelia sp. RM2_1_2]
MKNTILALSLSAMIATPALAADFDDYTSTFDDFTVEVADFTGTANDFGTIETETPVSLIVEGLEQVDSRLPRVVDLKVTNPSEVFVRNVIILNLDQYNPTGARNVTVTPTVTYRVTGRPQQPTVIVKDSSVRVTTHRTVK